MYKFAKRAQISVGSAIRNLLKYSMDPENISLAGGLPAPEMFPVKEMKEICTKVLNEKGKVALQYGSTDGVLALREALAKYLKKVFPEIKADDILITSGSQQGLDLSGKVFLEAGDVVLCEDPSYIGAINAFKAYGVDFVGVPMDDGGMDMDALEKSLQENPGAKLIYTIPNFQNPTGRTMKIERRKKLAELGSRYNVIVLEDNPYGELIYDGEPLPTIKSFDKTGNVVYLGSTSKIFSPGMRIAWVYADKEILQKYMILKQSADVQTNEFAQYIIAEFFNNYDIEAHVKKIRELYGHRKNVIVEAMKREFPENVRFTDPEGGMFTWVELPEGFDADAMFEKALAEKVVYVPGSAFYAKEPKKNTMRLNFSNMTDERIVEGIKRLGNLFRKYL
ncbi:MAG: PLP-dependent aminotransferase family protein [Clostridiaceae bacterium]